MIVADSNLIAYLLIPGEKSAMAEAVFRRDPEWAAPLLCRSELRNILALYMRTQKMPLASARKTMALAEGLLKDREYSVPSDEVLELSARHGISAYDAEFVLLAARLEAPLVTFDRPLLKACADVTVAPDKFAAN